MLNIPNSYPYKDQILSEIEEARRIKAEEAAARKEEAKRRRAELKALDGEVMKDADEESSEEEEEDEDEDMDTDSEGEEVRECCPKLGSGKR